MHIHTEGSTEVVADAIIGHILDAKSQLNQCRCGATVEQFKIVFPETADKFSAVCLGCQKGSAFVVADDYDHPIMVLKMARHINRSREALGFMVEKWNEYRGPFFDPSRVIHMSTVLPDPNGSDWE